MELGRAAVSKTTEAIPMYGINCRYGVRSDSEKNPEARDQGGFEIPRPNEKISWMYLPVLRSEPGGSSEKEIDC